MTRVCFFTIKLLFQCIHAYYSISCDTHCYSREAYLVIALSQQAPHLGVIVVKVLKRDNRPRDILTATDVIVLDSCQSVVEPQCNGPHCIISKAIATIKVIVS